MQKQIIASVLPLQAVPESEAGIDLAQLHYHLYNICNIRSVGAGQNPYPTAHDDIYSRGSSETLF